MLIIQRLVASLLRKGVGVVIEDLQRYLNGSQVEAVKLQAPISYRVIPQVHGALHDALIDLRCRIESTFSQL